MPKDTRILFVTGKLDLPACYQWLLQLMKSTLWSTTIWDSSAGFKPRQN